MSNRMMVAVYPPKRFLDVAYKYASAKSIEEGLHVTLLYLGEVENADEDRLAEMLTSVCRRINHPLHMYMNGPAIFANDDSAVQVLLMNAVGLDVLRYALLQEFMPLLGRQEHGFLPHLTLEYHDHGELPDDWYASGLAHYPKFEVRDLYLVREDEVVATAPLGKSKSKAKV